MSDGHALLTGLLRGVPPSRPLFLPLVDDLALRVAAAPRAALTADPALWARATRQAAALVGGDALTLGFDTAPLTAVVIGAAGDPAQAETHEAALALAAAMDHALVGGGHGLAVALPGPATLALAAAGESSRAALDRVVPALGRLMEAVCRRRPQMVVLIEDAAARAVPVDATLRRAYAPLRKIAAYYDLLCAVCTQGYAAAEAAAEVERLAPLGLDACWLGAPAEGGDAPVDGAACLAAGQAFRLVVTPLVLDRPELAARQAADAWAAAGGAGPWPGLTSAGPLPADCALERIRETRTALGAPTA